MFKTQKNEGNEQLKNLNSKIKFPLSQKQNTTQINNEKQTLNSPSITIPQWTINSLFKLKNYQSIIIQIENKIKETKIKTK